MIVSNPQYQNNKIIKEQTNSYIFYLCDNLIKYGLPILYLLIAVMFYLRTYDSCQIKITLIQIGGTLLILLWLLKILENPTEEIKFYYSNLSIVLPIILFLISGINSHLVMSSMKKASGMELIRRVIYMGISLLVIREFNSVEKFSRLLRWLYVAVFISTFYGLIQFLDIKFFLPNPEPGIDPFIWRQAFGTRVFSTFGNPNFYGDFLVVMGPIVLAMFMKTKNSLLLILWLMISFNAYVTYSKGTWIGYAAGFVYFWLLYLTYFTHFKTVNIKKYVFVSIILIVLITTLGVYYQLTQRRHSAKFRIYTWTSCWEMINVSPILGNGIGTFYVTYPAWRRPQIFYIEGKHNTESDHPENEYLEVWYDEGMIGIGIFLWLISTFTFSGIAALKKFSLPTMVTDKKGKIKEVSEDIRAYIMLGLLSGFWATLTHNFVCVSLRFVSSGVFLWLLVGLIGALVVNNPLPVFSKEKNVISAFTGIFVFSLFWLFNFLWWKMVSNVAITVVACLFIIGLILESGKIPFSEFKHELSLKEKFNNVWKYFISVVQLSLIFIAGYLFTVFRGYFIGDIHHNIAIFYSKQGNWSEALTNYNIVAKHNPGFIMCHYFMGNVFNDRWLLNREFHPEWGDKETDLPWSEIDLGKKGRVDPERSIAKYEDVWKLAPNYVQSHHQAGVVYLKLGAYFKNLGNVEKANYYWNKALECFWKYHKIDPIFHVNYQRMAWIYLQMGNIEMAEKVYKAHIYVQWLCNNVEDVINPKKIRSEEEKREYEELKKQFEEETQWNCCEYHKREHYLFSKEDWVGPEYQERRAQYSETYLQLGNLYYVRKDFANAEKFYLRAVKRYKDNLQAWKNLIVLYKETNQQEKLNNIIKWYQQLFPQDINLSKLTGI